MSQIMYVLYITDVYKTIMKVINQILSGMHDKGITILKIRNDWL